MDGIASGQNTFGLPTNPYGLINRSRQAIGASEVNLETADPLVSTRTHQIFFDTRSCIGELSLREAQLAFSFNTASNGKIPPERFKQVLQPDGSVSLLKLLEIVEQMDRDGLISGFPRRQETGTGNSLPYIQGNVIRFDLSKTIKEVISLELINVIIPRDIIPMYVYFPGFIENCLPFQLSSTGANFLNPLAAGPNSIWDSPVPPEINDFIDPTMGSSLSAIRLGGVFETPLRYWRTYTGPNSMSRTATPPPYQLWNPPQNSFTNDPWPFQPVPVRQQRIPTYRAKNGVVFSGYGLYDLEDFPPLQQLQLADGSVVQIPLRKLILKLIVPKGQYINGTAAETLIDISTDDDFNDAGIVENPTTQTGYGDYQRFIPGPGLTMNYQPNQVRDGKAAPIDLSLSTYDSVTGTYGPMPVPFPNFRGNRFGPYGRPGDAFQNNSLLATVDELYLNGDLDNLAGNPIIFENYNPTKNAYSFEEFSLVLRSPNDAVRFQNFETASNPNIKNAMRVSYDGGFGAVFAYVGENTSEVGQPGPIITGGLPNTQYDGELHPLNPTVWVTPRTANPSNWIESLPGPQKPTIVSSNTFAGWLYVWRNVYPYTGEIYVPVTAGGSGTMEHFDGVQWVKTTSSYDERHYTLGSAAWTCSPVIGQSNSWCFPDTSTNEVIGNLPYGDVTTLSITTAGTNYGVGNSVPVTGGTGSGLLIDILTVDGTGAILTFAIDDAGTGYTTGDVVTIDQTGSDLNATFTITTATAKPDNVIPEYNQFHYMDPLAVGPSQLGTGAALTINYADGIDDCTNVCTNTVTDNCTAPGGKYVFQIGNEVEDFSTACDIPTPTPDPPQLLKCDFRDLTSPEDEWTSGNKQCRPENNARQRQVSNYIDRRVAYNDSGANNGRFITELINYRSYFISSTPDTDFIIRIRNNMDRSIYTQSISPQLSASNFYTPIRLNLGSVTGTQQYVEATQGTLTGCSSCYWQKIFEPPMAEMSSIEMELFTFDGTPIPIERSLGFLEQLKGFSSLFTATISSSSALTITGNLGAFSPNLPPFLGVLSTSPSSVLLTATPNSRTSVEKSFSPYTETYTQRNINIMFKVVNYHNENPGIMTRVKSMPTAETFESVTHSSGLRLLPLAANIDNYSQ